MNRTQTHEDIQAWLQAAGWRKSQSGGNEIWYKRFPNAPRCKCNSDKEGVQVVVVCWTPVFKRAFSYDVDVTAQKLDGVWVKLMAYAIGAELCDVLDAQAAQLVAAWTALATAPVAAPEPQQNRTKP